MVQAYGTTETYGLLTFTGTGAGSGVVYAAPAVPRNSQVPSVSFSIDAPDNVEIWLARLLSGTSYSVIAITTVNGLSAGDHTYEYPVGSFLDVQTGDLIAVRGFANSVRYHTTVPAGTYYFTNPFGAGAGSTGTAVTRNDAGSRGAISYELLADLVEAPDTATATATAPARATGVGTEAADTASGTATAPVHATSSGTEAPDTAAATATAPVHATAAGTEAADSASAAAVARASGTAAATEDPDTAAATALARSGANVSQTEASDTGSATAVAPIHATSGATEADDTAAAAATAPDHASVAGTESSDTSSATASAPAKGALAGTEAADSASSTGVARASATVGANEASDTASATASAPVHGSATPTEASDVSSATGAAPVRGSLAGTEAADSSSGTATVPAHGGVSGAEDADLLSATGSVRTSASLSATESDDALNAILSGPQSMRLDAAEEGYQVAFTAQVRADPTDGGLGRFRRDLLGANPIADIRWVTDEDGFNYLRAFYRTGVEGGTRSFQIRLYIDSATLEEYSARFVPGSFQLSSVAGETYTVNAQLEVTSKPADQEADAAIIMTYDLYGEDGPAIYGLLAELVNVSLPAALSA